jgi:hypothetical protein
LLVVVSVGACSTPSSASPNPGQARLRPATAPIASLPTAMESQRQEVPLPEAREETAAATLDQNLYVLGGFDAAGKDTNTVFVYNGGSWKRGPSLPISLDHPAAAVASRRLFVAGGFKGGVASAQVFVLAPNGLAWEPAPPMRRARGALGLVGIGTHLYALGGRGALGEVAVPEVYEAPSGTWTDLTPLPQPRDHLAGFADSQRPCVAGGVSPDTARVDCLDPATVQWTRLPDLPARARGAGGAGLGPVDVVAGGEDGAETHLVDLVMRWRGTIWETEPMLSPRHGFELAALGGRLWACGGGVAPGLHPASTCTSIAS